MSIIRGLLSLWHHWVGACTEEKDVQSHGEFKLCFQNTNGIFHTDTISMTSRVWKISWLSARITSRC